MKVRRWTILLALLPLFAVLSDRPGSAGPPQSAKTRILLATVSANYREGLLRLAHEYETLHPDVDVQIQIQPVNGYETWLRTQVGSGSDAAPDIYNVNYTQGFYERGLLVNLTPFLAQNNPYTGSPWRDNLNAHFVEQLKVGGDVAMAPLDSIEVAFFYNRDIFTKLGLRPPRTWEEMIAQAERIRRAGYIPFAVPGDADSYWSGTVGWIFRFLTDAYCRDLVPLVMSHPGDWDYDARRNGSFHLDLADPQNDALVVLNSERLLIAIRDGKIRMDSDRFREAYQKMAEFASYWERGFNGTSANSAYQLFLTQKAAIMLQASPSIGQLLKDMNDLYPQDRFVWGIFPIPPITRSRFHLPPLRGIGGAGVTWGVVKKSAGQTRRAVDFLMFVTTAHAAQILVEEAVKARQPINGSMLAPGTHLPASIAAYYPDLSPYGFEKLTFRGFADEQESVWKWTVWAQRYLDGRISLDECLSRYEQVMQEAVPRVAGVMNYDMDPRTKDQPKP